MDLPDRRVTQRLATVRAAPVVALVRQRGPVVDLLPMGAVVPAAPADSYIDAGEIEQATAVVQSSLTVMGNVSSVRPRERLVKVAGRLAEHKDLPVVRDLLGSHSLHPLDVRR